MLNMKYLAILAGITLFVGVVILVLAANPLVALLGKLAIAVSCLGFAAAATAYLTRQTAMALAFRNEDFHWY